MPNKRFNKQVHAPDKGKPPVQKRGEKHSIGTSQIRTANWPGLPGASQPKDRSGGVRKVRQSAKDQGI